MRFCCMHAVSRAVIAEHRLLVLVLFVRVCCWVAFIRQHPENYGFCTRVCNGELMHCEAHSMSECYFLE